MSVSQGSFIAIWTALMIIWMALTYQYRNKWGKQISRLGDAIRRYNTSKGYDQSIGRISLANAYIAFFDQSAIRSYAEANGLDTSRYKTELRENTIKRWKFLGIFIPHFAGLILTLGGAGYIVATFPIQKTLYITINIIILLISIIMYWNSWYVEN